MQPTFSNNFWRSLIICLIIEALVFWGCASCLSGCKKETSFEGPRWPPCDTACVYFKILKVQLGFNGDYTYNADVFCLSDTTRELMQYGINYQDTDFFKTWDRSKRCNLKVKDSYLVR